MQLHKGVGGATLALLVLGLLPLVGCETVQRSGLDPLTTSPRLSSSPISYDVLMRIGAAAQTGGDLDTAVGLYRRAAELNPHAAAPFVAAGHSLIEMGQINEAIVAYRSALARDADDPEALRGLARAYLLTGKPELAEEPLSIALRETPDDPKLLQLIGVAEDFTGRHAAAQAHYRRGLELLPFDPRLSLNLALSLALAGNYSEAIRILNPIAMGTTGTHRERQTLALIYALQGDNQAAGRIASLDLDPLSAQRSIAYYEMLRRLSPEARIRAIRSTSTTYGSQPPGPKRHRGSGGFGPSS